MASDVVPAVQNSRDEVLQSLGYKPERLAWKQTEDEYKDRSLCLRCGKKVYPVEKVDIGVLYHKGCFKCKQCNVTLTIKSFNRELDAQSNTKEVYCGQHVPKHSSHFHQDALEIQNALRAQQQKAGAKGLGVEEGWTYDQHEAIGYQHLKRNKSGRSSKLKRRSSTLKSFRDFEKYGVFDAQNALEKVHKEEEDALYMEIFEDRKQQVHMLEKSLRRERENTVRELIHWFEEKRAGPQERDDGLKKVEAYFSREREQRVRGLLQQLATEEQAAVTRMVEKHAQEMLALIAKKDHQAYRDIRRRSRDSANLDPDGLSQHSLNAILNPPDEGKEGDQSTAQMEEEGESEEDEEEQEEEEEEEEEGEEEKGNQEHSTGQSWEKNEEEFVENKENTIGECVGDVAVTRKKYRRSPNESSEQILPAEPPKSDPKVKSHSKSTKQSAAMQKLRDKLEMSMHSPNKGSKVVAGAGGNIQVRQVKGNQKVETFSPVAEESQRSHRKDDTSYSNDNVPHAHGHVSTSPYARRRVPQEPGKAVGSDSSPFQRGYQSTNQKGGQGLHGGKKGAAPVLSLQRPQGKQGTQGRDRTPDNSHRTPDISHRTLDNSHRTPGNHSTPQQGTPGRNIQREPPQGTPPNKNPPPAYQINIMVPGGGAGGRDHSDDSASTEYSSSSSEEEGEYNTKAPGVLLLHPADDSMLHIPDKDLPHEHPSESEDDSDEYTTEEEDDDDDDQEEANDHLGEIRTVSVIATGAQIATPRIMPPRDRKSTLYESEKVFEEFDNQAIQEAKKDHKTFTDLVRKLSRKCQTELQKVRALFRWITVKDLNKLDLEGPIDPDSPIGLLRGIKTGKESYHTLFKRLCSYAGLHCVIIDGFSKGAGYKPGAKLHGQAFRNQWTAVNVEGSWRFINCNWGARHVKGPKEAALTYKCDEFYFLTDAEDHIYQHFPDDEEWQLLKKPITMEDFVKFPVTKSPFYNKRLQFAYKYNAVLPASDGVAEVRLAMPKLLGFAAKLYNKEKKIPEEVVAERVLVRTIDKEVAVSVNLPMPGVYYLDIFVESDWRKNSMDHACAFAIRCTGVSRDAHVSYPQLGTFGRTPLFREVGLAEKSHHDPYISCRQETAITFDLSREVKLTHSFQLWSYRDRELQDYERYAVLSHRGSKSATYSLLCPAKGHYVFTVLAEDTASAHPEVVQRYIIDCRVANADARPFPRASKRWQHCKLMEPLQGDLPMDAQVVFRVESDVATELVVVVQGVWHGLQRQGEVWQGIVPTGNQQGKALVYAKFGGGKSKYIPCLEYNILSLRKYSFV